MKKWLSILSAGLLFYPFAAFTQDYGPQSPPVAQKLVREGDFAIRLAAELDLGTPANEAIAEDTLAKAGVAPANGWISDYPVTPEILGQLNDSVTNAAAQGKLPMTSEQASKGLYYLASQMDLPVPAGQESSGAGPAGQAPPTVVNNYYYNQGPPVITYYPPPADYVYLYDWVPYPVFWFGFWFPGFYMCHNFTTTVVVSPAFYPAHTVFVSRTAIVSNRIINPVTRTVVVVDPVVRTRGGSVRAMTALRAGDGAMYRTVSDMRRGNAMTGVSVVRQGSSFGPSRGQGFRSAESRRGAAAIYSRSVQAMRPDRSSGHAYVRSDGRWQGAPGRSARPYNYNGSSRQNESRYRSTAPSYGPSAVRTGSVYGRSAVSQRTLPAWRGGPVIKRGQGVPWRSGSGRPWRS